MNLSSILKSQWRPALGCTEPASIAYAASLASSYCDGEISGMFLRCDTRIFKNCFAVGIPNSQGKSGILWALAIGGLLPNPSLKLECFRDCTTDILKNADRLLKLGVINVQDDPTACDLLVDCKIIKSNGSARVIIKGSHTNVVHIEKNGQIIQANSEESKNAKKNEPSNDLAEVSLSEIFDSVKKLSANDRNLLQEGIKLNLKMADHGLLTFHNQLPELTDDGLIGQLGKAVYAAVLSRMSGENLTVMSAAGSGNKGLTLTIPLAMYGKSKHAQDKINEKLIEESLAMAIIMNAITTQKLGTLSAICGCSNAAGIGLAAGLVYFQGGREKEVSFAVNNMVGNIAGMICDGAKIGCALKAMTAVDAAFRAASFAIKNISIPYTDGIVGKTGIDSLNNLGKIAQLGMNNMDHQILQIMREKL